MAEMPLSKFHGTAEDYLNWFNGVEFEKVVLPKSQTDGKGLQVPETEQDSCSFIDTSAYMDRKHGQDYAAKYKKEFEALPLVDTKQHSKVWSVEEDTMTESLLNEDGVNAAQVYLHYNFCVYNQDSTLPVFDDQKLFILDDAAEKNVHCNIVVTQPRKIAAISLARRVCTERNWVLGKLVGYQVGLDKRTDIDTRLVYVTAEVLVQTLINQRSLDKFTHIILDEVHERSAETDFAILLVKKLLRSVSPRVKIILMSATIDTFKFSEYFATPVTDQLVPAPVISIGKRTRHKIMTFYLEDLRVICRDRPTIIPKLPRINPGNPSIDDDMYKFVVEMISCFDILEENTEKMVTTRGAVLVFLPGLFQIECLIDHLGERAERYKWQLFPLHSSITHEEQQLAFSTQPKGFRKIILSTNIAESSVTITDIKYVIDFCLTKVLTYDSATNYTSLKMDWSSQASCQQKAGRCGRVSSGRVYRLIPQSFFRVGKET
ncbi:ATP-dependent RNA helicase TDRD9-like 1, partial [Homarus americanus]